MSASVVLFAGAGGSSVGIAQATGEAPELAINHNPAALAVHALNCTSRVLCEDVFAAQPWRVWPRGKPLGLLWASPDCTHFSRAKGAAPVSAGRRSLADVVIDWAAQARPAVILLENVPEFQTWGPLTSEGVPDKARAGEFFQAWLLRLRLLGYRVEWRCLRSCDYGVPTIRRRLYLVARCDGRPIVWPEPTHGPGLLPYVPAASCIDWNDLGTSIFDRPRPLAEKTMARIFEGLQKFVVEAPEPFILNLSHGGRLESLADPLRTITATPRGGDRALVVPWLTKLYGTARSGRSLEAPAPSVSAQGQHEALTVAWLAKHYGGPRAVCGSDLRAPLGTVTTQDHHSLVAAYLVQYYGTGGQGSHPADPLPAVVTKARHGLVTVTLQGQEWAVQDITLRMLKPRELARAQGFPDSFQLQGSIAEQIAQIGNAVCPPMAEALVRAQLHQGRAAA